MRFRNGSSTGLRATGRRSAGTVGLALVALLAAPVPSARAEQAYIAEGGGSFVGNIHYGGGGLPFLQPCSSAGFTLTADFDMAYADAALVAFVGPVSMTAVATPDLCESFLLPVISWGQMSITVTGTGPTGGTILCTATDNYSREGNVVTFSTDQTGYGTCLVNDYPSQAEIDMRFTFLYDNTNPFVSAAAIGEIDMAGRCPTSCE